MYFELARADFTNTLDSDISLRTLVRNGRFREPAEQGKGRRPHNRRPFIFGPAQ